MLPDVAAAQGATPAAAPSVLVTTQAPHKGSLPRTITAYGTIEAAPGGGSETLSLLRAGQVTQVQVRPGEEVRRGQALLVISAEPGELASYKQAAAALALAQSQRLHAAQLLAQHLGTRDQLATAEKAATDAQSALDALDRAGGNSPQQTLSAPFDGIVSGLLTAPGARVAAQTPLLTLARSSRLVAAVGVEPGQRDQVAVNQPAQVEPLYTSGKWRGRVMSVGAMLDPTTRLVPVLVDPSPDGPPNGPVESSPLPGEPVRAIMQVGQMTGWLAPRDAVLTDTKGPYVFQVDADKAVRVDVHVVGTAGDTTIISGPLDPSRLLVSGGNYQLQDGTAVRDAPADPSGAAPGGTTAP